ncbi:MAG TPA: arsenate reductase ArsC [Burkholderiales bacterium]|nr:arsenate reductase ArsC [Burkholderiales bacterium]
MLKVLFLCTGNSARSVMAEALLNALGKGRFKAYSAGSMPAGRVNPFTLELLARRGHPVQGLRSKSWDEFAAPGAPVLDIVITVCDNAAGEVCPVWPGRPANAHWSFEDPAAFAGTDDAKREKFEQIYQQIRAHVERLLALPLEAMNRANLAAELKAIAQREAHSS